MSQLENIAMSLLEFFSSISCCLSQFRCHNLDRIVSNFAIKYNLPLAVVFILFLQWHHPRA
jgi:hypothetical protein